MSYEQLQLENQICFPFYAVSRLIIRLYQPLLDELGITYPQYLVLLLLWEKDEQPVNDIAKRLILNTNTMTPLVKRLETLGIVERRRSPEDERKVLVTLTEKGRKLEEKAAKVPQKMLDNIDGAEEFSQEELFSLKKQLNKMIQLLK